MYTTKIIELMNIDHFRKLVKKHKARIRISPHAFKHLSTVQRKLFGEEELSNILLKEKPKIVGLQRNGRYAIFYRRKWGYIRIILEIKEQNIEIITFINTANIPNLKNEN